MRYSLPARSDEHPLSKTPVVSPKGALAPFIVLLGLTLLLASNAKAQITVRQAASAKTPDQNCSWDYSQYPPRGFVHPASLQA